MTPNAGTNAGSDGGEGGIRTRGPFQDACFQDIAAHVRADSGATVQVPDGPSRTFPDRPGEPQKRAEMRAAHTMSGGR